MDHIPKKINITAYISAVITRPETINRLSKEFLLYAATSVEQLKSYILTQDYTSIYQTADRLKGTGCLLQFELLKQAADLLIQSSLAQNQSRCAQYINIIEEIFRSCNRGALEDLKQSNPIIEYSKV